MISTPHRSSGSTRRQGRWRGGSNRSPGDRWDYDCTAKLVFADLDGGGPRKALMQANKNGYFYVIDRASGEVLAAHNYACT